MSNNVILLDIDGVLVTQGWKRVEILDDGFFAFNVKAAKNLSKIIKQTSANIILTTSYRGNYTSLEWKNILAKRGIEAGDIKKMDDFGDYINCNTRAQEINKWIHKYRDKEDYVIIDDDVSLDKLPFSIKNRWVKTEPLIGLDEESSNKAVHILNGYNN